MEKRQLLFVTHGDGNMTEGVPYAIELAKAMDEDIMILLVQKRPDLTSKFDDLMTTVTFAEAGDHSTAKQTGSTARPGPDEDSDQELSVVVQTCLREGIQATVYTSPLGAMAGIRAFIKKQWGIDKVLLSPAITRADDISSKDIMRLVRVISRPVVTMARQRLAVAGGLKA
jgi:hypothetical protein